MEYGNCSRSRTGVRKAARWLVSLLVLLGLMGSAPALRAQGVSGRILGSVQDSSGAVIGRASVTATDTGTGITTTITSDANGQYRLDNLQPGTYKVEVKATGFRPFISNGNVVNVDEATRLDATLQVGSAGETIEVS